MTNKEKKDILKRELSKTILKIVKQSKASFFCAADYKADKEKDRIMDDSLYEMKAAIYENLDWYFNPKKCEPYNKEIKSLIEI